MQALEEADDDQDKVVALAVEYALALQKSPGELPPEGFYTSVESIFEALMPRGDGGISPVKLLKTKWIKERAAKLKSGDDRRRAAQAAAATPAGPRTRAGGVYERRGAQGVGARE